MKEPLFAFRLLPFALLLFAFCAAGQETYTRTYRVDSLGTDKWYLTQIDTWLSPVPSLGSEKTASVQENQFFASSKADLANLVSALRSQASAQKTEAEVALVRADSMYVKLNSIYARLTDSESDSFPFSRSSTAPPAQQPIITQPPKKKAPAKNQKSKGQ